MLSLGCRMCGLVSKPQTGDQQVGFGQIDWFLGRNQRITPSKLQPSRMLMCKVRFSIYQSGRRRQPCIFGSMLLYGCFQTWPEEVGVWRFNPRRKRPALMEDECVSVYFARWRACISPFLQVSHALLCPLWTLTGVLSRLQLRMKCRGGRSAPARSIHSFLMSWQLWVKWTSPTAAQPQVITNASLAADEPYTQSRSSLPLCVAGRFTREPVSLQSDITPAFLTFVDPNRATSEPWPDVLDTAVCHSQASSRPF